MTLIDFSSIEASRITRFQSAWERRVHHYELLLNAGVPDDEALRIVTDVARKELDQQQRRAA